MPRQNNKTAENWRRTRQLKEALELARHLDGTRTVAEAARVIGFETDTKAYRALAALRYLAAEHPHLVQHSECREGNRVYHTITILEND